MRSFILAVLAPTLLATPLAAQCPAAPDHAAEIDAIIAEIRAAPDEGAARDLADALWEFWTDAPDARAQDLLDRGMELRGQYAFLEAWGVLDELVEYCPDYAEGYNQRAFASFLRRDYRQALRDLDRALALDPRHIGALSGRALTLMGLGRAEEGQAALRQALDLNPWLPERSLLTDPPGEDI